MAMYDVRATQLREQAPCKQIVLLIAYLVGIANYFDAQLADGLFARGVAEGQQRRIDPLGHVPCEFECVSFRASINGVVRAKQLRDKMNYAEMCFRHRVLARQVRGFAIFSSSRYAY